MAWTESDLTELESAIKSGARRVKYADKEVEYRDLSEMLQVRNMMRKELGVAAGRQRVYASFDKGLRGEDDE